MNDAAPAKSFRLEYDLDLEDVVAFSQHHFDTTLSQRRLRILRIFAGPLAIAAAVAVSLLVNPALGNANTRSVFFGFFLFLVILVFGWLTLLPTIFQRAVLRAIRQTYSDPRNAGFLGHRILSWDESGITESGERGETCRAWKDIRRIDVALFHVFIYVGDVLCFIAPRRAFASEEALREFVETLERFRPRS